MPKKTTKKTTNQIRRTYRIPAGPRVFLGFYEGEEKAAKYDMQAANQGESRTQWLAKACAFYYTANAALAKREKQE